MARALGAWLWQSGTDFFNYLTICNVLQISPMELLNENQDEHFILLNNKDLEDLTRILTKIQTQTQNININDNHGTININQERK